MTKEYLVKQLFKYITHFDESELTELLMTVGYIITCREKSPTVSLQSIPKDEVHSWLRTNLNHNKASITKFSEMCGICRMTIYRYLKKSTYPNQQNYDAMVRAFDKLEKLDKLEQNSNEIKQ